MLASRQAWVNPLNDAVVGRPNVDWAQAAGVRNAPAIMNASGNNAAADSTSMRMTCTSRPGVRCCRGTARFQPGRAAGAPAVIRSLPWS